jgi:hypothetical protein
MSLTTHDLVCQIVAIHKSERTILTPKRVMDSVLLADWRAAITIGKPLTNIQWLAASNGIRADEVEAAIFSSDKLIIANKEIGQVVSLRSGVRISKPSGDVAPVLAHLKETIPQMGIIEFHQLMISIFPAMDSSPGDFLDLTALAADYIENYRPLLEAGRTAS